MKNSAIHSAPDAWISGDNGDGNTTAEIIEPKTRQSGAEPRLPRGGQLNDLLALRFGGSVAEILDAALLEPVKEVTYNPGKKIRAQLVNLSSRLIRGADGLSASGERRRRLCAEVLEFIHAGSLVVDDIEDGSKVRRGRPALHVRHGMPVALNAGNWLYFWPFELLRSAGFSQEKLLFAYEQYHKTLLRAHFGQAVDLGARIDRIDQESVPKVCLAAMELKTGALMGFATLLGGLLADADRRGLTILREFGEGLGVALQMFDDLGNVTGNREPSKRFEDLMLYRPSWVWAMAAKDRSSADYQRFVLAVHALPDERQLENWLTDHSVLDRGRQNAAKFMAEVFAELQRKLTQSTGRAVADTIEELRGLGDEIARAYE